MASNEAYGFVGMAACVMVEEIILKMPPSPQRALLEEGILLALPRQVQKWDEEVPKRRFG